MNNTSQTGVYYWGSAYILTFDTQTGQPLRLENLNINARSEHWQEVWDCAKMWNGGFGGLDFSTFVLTLHED